MKRNWMLAAAVVVVLPVVALAQAVKTPPAAEVTAMDTDMAGTDAAAKSAALEKLKGWVKGGYVSDHLWRNWIPGLQKDATKNQDIADLCLEAVMHRPDPAAAYTLMTFRFQALTALKKYEEALAAAKSYFNVVQMTQTTRGLDAIAGIIGRVHPDDLEIVRKFRAEQTDAAAGKPMPEHSIMKSIKIDASAYDDALKAYKDKTDVRSQIAYGDLLLLADKGEEAEKVFRDVYQVATEADLPAAAEGIAKALRAEDGNPARANGWYKDIQATLATQAATKPAAATGASATASRPAPVAAPASNLP